MSVLTDWYNGSVQNCHIHRTCSHSLCLKTNERQSESEREGIMQEKTLNKKSKNLILRKNTGIKKKMHFLAVLIPRTKLLL